MKALEERLKALESKLGGRCAGNVVPSGINPSSLRQSCCAAKQPRVLRRAGTGTNP